MIFGQPFVWAVGFVLVLSIFVALGFARWTYSKLRPENVDIFGVVLSRGKCDPIDAPWYRMLRAAFVLYATLGTAALPFVVAWYQGVPR